MIALGTPPVPAGDRAGLRLRLRLIEMRAKLVSGLDVQLDAGSLALLAGIAGALAALEAHGEVVADAAQAQRAVIADDGSAILLALYDTSGAVAAVPLSAQRAIGMAGELIAAALRRLP